MNDSVVPRTVPVKDLHEALCYLDVFVVAKAELLKVAVNAELLKAQHNPINGFHCQCKDCGANGATVTVITVSGSLLVPLVGCSPVKTDRCGPEEYGR
jgi:hypothetical protein